jgi:hypothetical protein
MKESGLTQKALAQLDSSSIANLDNNFDARTIISESSGGNTFRSWATNWSDCTNATFNKVHRYWKSNSSLHKEVAFLISLRTTKKAYFLSKIRRFWPFLPLLLKLSRKTTVKKPKQNILLLWYV